MFNAINKMVSCTALAAVLMCAGCSDKEAAAAGDLLSRSEAAVAEHRYADAVELLDTLNARYSKQTDVRRQALRIRAAAMEGIALDSISAGDRALAEATLTLEAIRPRFRHVESNVGLEGYFLPKGISEKTMGVTSIQGRVTDKGYFYIVANVQNRSIGLRSLRLVAGGESVESEPVSASRVVKVGSSETVSFSPEDVAAIGPWLEQHQADKAVLVGAKGKADIKLNAKMRAELLDCYKFACALQAQRLASIHREKYERMLATARDQLANLAPAQNENE